MNNFQNRNATAVRLSSGGFSRAVANAQPNSPASEWPDWRLITAIRNEPMNILALDTLIDRYWKPLFAQCQILTVNRAQAVQLAEETWKRILREPTFLPTEAFFTYLSANAADLWRDQIRAAEVTEVIDAGQESPLELLRTAIDEKDISFVQAAVENLEALSEDEQLRLSKTIDLALGKLAPAKREVLLSHSPGVRGVIKSG